MSYSEHIKVLGDKPDEKGYKPTGYLYPLRLEDGTTLAVSPLAMGQGRIIRGKEWSSWEDGW